MPRSTRSDVAALRQEARAIELLADEASPGPAQLQDYWNLSADLIALVTEIEEFAAAAPNATDDDPTMFALRRRLRALMTRLADFTADD